ncbi:hypothetical protein PG985_009445 [Apiospora marii]|uniref:uncharacterized protein n=1 Tax=Apiospora marii TaxID=335849 RepID=UPI00312CC705
MANSVTEISWQCISRFLEFIHPLIAKRRIRELDINPEVLRAISFNSDCVSTLREVLDEISHGGQFDAQFLASRLQIGNWPMEAYNCLLDILITAAPITDTEFRSACLQCLNKDTTEIFKNSKTFANCITYHEFGEKLTKYFAGDQRDEQKFLEIIDGMVEHSNTDGDSRLGKILREALYFYLISHDSSIYLSGYHDSEMLTLAKRCSLHVAMHAATIVHASGQSSPRLQKIIRCMKTGSRTMGIDYITELYLLMRQLNANESTIFFEAVYSSCIKLHKLPRHIARNYLVAMDRGDWECAEGAMSEILVATYPRLNKAEVHPILEDLNDVCGSGLPSTYLKIPLSLSDASEDLLIDLNNSLLLYLSSKSRTYEGDFILRVLHWPSN